MMDYNIIVLSHGRFCEEIVKSSEMIVGELSNVHSVPLLETEEAVTYEEKVRKLIDALDSNKPCIMLVDVIGGTPYNCCLKLMQDYDIYAVTGVCMGMLLEVPYLNAKDAKAAAEILLNASKSSGKLICREELFN